MTNAATRPFNSDRFPHFMIKEIYEQPEMVRRMLAHWLEGSGSFIAPAGFPSPQELRRVSKITVAASGSSRHAGLVGKFMLERLAGVLVEVDFASQYCYRDPLVWPDELTILISQSGTTVDTLAALREARRKSSKSLAICNVPDSPLTLGVDATLLTYAGEEVAIAATKTFTTQLTALLLLAVHVARCRKSCLPALEVLQRELQTLPRTMECVLAMEKQYQEIARKFADSKSFLVMGRNIEYPIALEGALKLKETSHIQAEGYPTGEIKHGPAALIDQDLPIVVLATRDDNDPASMVSYEKTVSNIREFAEQGVPVVALTTKGDHEIAKHTTDVISLPRAPALLQPMLEVIPLQMMAYHMGVLRGYDVDRPRNLSKSVMVE